MQGSTVIASDFAQHWNNFESGGVHALGSAFVDKYAASMHTWVVDSESYIHYLTDDL